MRRRTAVKEKALKVHYQTKGHQTMSSSADEGKPSNEAVAEFLEGRKKYEELKKQKRKKGSGREERVGMVQYWFHTEMLIRKICCTFLIPDAKLVQDVIKM